MSDAAEDFRIFLLGWTHEDWDFDLFAEGIEAGAFRWLADDQILALAPDYGMQFLPHEEKVLTVRLWNWQPKSAT